jgi:hypothetical protein
MLATLAISVLLSFLHRKSRRLFVIPTTFPNVAPKELFQRTRVSYTIKFQYASAISFQVKSFSTLQSQWH